MKAPVTARKGCEIVDVDLQLCITPANHSSFQNALCNIKNMSQSEVFLERHAAHLFRLYTHEAPPKEDGGNCAFPSCPLF
jgi:hypothetical protein